MGLTLTLVMLLTCQTLTFNTTRPVVLCIQIMLSTAGGHNAPTPVTLF